MRYMPDNPGLFPTVRMRRLRMLPAVRRLVAEVDLQPRNLILPLFVRPGNAIRKPVTAMPGVFQLSLDELAKEVDEIARLGIGGIILFGIPDHKDPVGSDAQSDLGIIPQAVKLIKDKAPELLVITDVCFCEYTDHGHCGIVSRVGGRVELNNDETLRILGIQALVHAKAGADIVAPSGMIDGMVSAIRTRLDDAGFEHVLIMSYAAKYASAFYGPFREAAESAPQFGDRRSYQMDPAAHPGQALREIELDLAEGADIVMVKPALAYLDIIRMVKDNFPGVPIAAYNVSGEYSMIHAAAANRWIDLKAVALECLTAIRRAGASIILTYFAKDVVSWLG